MCVMKTGRWASSLRRSLRLVYEPTTRVPVPWLLSGEAALALQEVSVEPELIEFRAISPVAVAYFAQFMKPYELPANAVTVVYRRGGNMPPSESWCSNIHQRLVAWSAGGRATWLGRWYVDGSHVQVSYTQSVQADPVSLAANAQLRRAHFEGMAVPVVPLEYLLADSVFRAPASQGTHGTVTQRILHTLRASHYNPNDLRAALDTLPAEKASRLMRLLEMSVVA